MTSFAVNYNWTPELIAKDKALKEKFGPAAHMIPAKTIGAPLERVPSKDMASLNTLNNEPLNKKNNKTRNALLTAGGLILTAAALYNFRGKLKNLLPNFAGNSGAAVKNDITERVLANGKKVQKIVENTENGAKKVIMNVFDEAGNLVLNKEKVITRSVNAANGKKYINIKNTYSSPGNGAIGMDGGVYPFKKNLSYDVNKYYSQDGKLMLKTAKGFIPGDPCNFKNLEYHHKNRIDSSITYYKNLKRPGVRTCRYTLLNSYTRDCKTSRNIFSPEGTALKTNNA